MLAQDWGVAFVLASCALETIYFLSADISSNSTSVRRNESLIDIKSRVHKLFVVTS
jgi:hypothetical protein